MKEIRNNDNLISPIGNDRHVSGYALVFDVESVDLGGFTEIIERGAIDENTIANSDVLCLLDHNDERGVLARCKFGEGSLKLTIDDHGLKYEFDAPNTALGDEVIEGLKRGDITTSSFAFVCESDEWVKKPDGTILRKITKIKQIFDVSPVYHPAYEATEVKVDTRGLSALLDNENNIDISMNKTKRSKRSTEELLDEIKALVAEIEGVEEEPRSDEEPEEVEEVEEETETPDEEEREEETEEVAEEEETAADEETDPEEEEKAEEEEPEAEKENEIRKSNQHTSMKFSLIKTINDIVNHRSLDESAKKLNIEGRKAMRKAGLAAEGNISIPVELRDDPTAPVGVLATVPTHGKENVATDKLNILEPLRANMVLAKAGATYLTGLVGDVSIPVYSGSNVGWKGEVVAADNGEGAFAEVVLKPKRLTAFVDVSKQFLAQDSNDAEEMLKRDIINAIGEKLEQTILGSAAGDDTKPAGLFNGVSADTAAVKFENIVDMEAELDEANVSGDICYIVSPKAKAILRKTSKDNGSGRFIMEEGEIEGVNVLCSSAVATKGMVVGNFNDYVIAQWGALDLTIDSVSRALNGEIRIVINAYFDAKPRRTEAFAKRILK